MWWLFSFIFNACRRHWTTFQLAVAWLAKRLPSGILKTQDLWNTLKLWKTDCWLLFSHKIVFALIRLTKSFICCWYLKQALKFCSVFCKRTIYVLIFLWKIICSIYIPHFSEEQIFIFPILQRSCLHIFLHFAGVCICLNLNFQFAFIVIFVLIFVVALLKFVTKYLTLNKVRLTAYSVEMFTF